MKVVGRLKIHSGGYLVVLSHAPITNFDRHTARLDKLMTIPTPFRSEWVKYGQRNTSIPTMKTAPHDNLQMIDAPKDDKKMKTKASRKKCPGSVISHSIINQNKTDNQIMSTNWTGFISIDISVSLDFFLFLFVILLFLVNDF